MPTVSREMAPPSRSICPGMPVWTARRAQEKRLKPTPGLIYASPIVADGKLYYISREKGTYVVAAKPEFELLAHNRFAGDTSVCNGSPVVMDGKLLLRSDKYLYCLAKLSGEK